MKRSSFEYGFIRSICVGFDEVTRISALMRYNHMECVRQCVKSFVCEMEDPGTQKKRAVQTDPARVSSGDHESA